MPHIIIDGRHVLDRCPYCGRHAVRPAALSNAMCEECHGKLKRYHALKHKLKQHPNNETSEQLAVIIADYNAAKERGLKVPRDIM